MHYEIAVRVWNGKGNRKRIVTAIVRGHLALHRSEDVGMWTLTHIPTGTVISHFHSCRIARRAMRALLAFNWSFTRLYGPKFESFTAFVQPVVTALRETDSWRVLMEDHADAIT